MMGAITPRAPGVRRYPRKQWRGNGFTLVELLVVTVIIGVLTCIALPGYRQYAVRASRVAVQVELLQLAALQDKIFLNSNAYAFGVSGVIAPYTGTETGGLGRASGRSIDGRYALSLVVLASSTLCASGGATFTVRGAQTFVLMAAPVASGQQATESNLCVSESGARLWGRSAW